MLPDRNSGLDLIDKVTVRLKGGFAVGGSGEGDDGWLTDFQSANAVDGYSVGDVELLKRLGEDFLAFLFCHCRVVLVVKTEDVSALVMVPNEALKGNDGSASGISEVFAQRGQIEGDVLDGEHGKSY